MTDEPTRERFSLKRWSQRKHAVAREVSKPAAPETPSPVVPASSAVPAAGTTPKAAEAALPSVESLTFDADFTAFMKPDVDPSLKRDALKKLFSDPRFNVMDGLDTYIDDYTKFEPLDAETARSLVSARYIFDPPKTRVNKQGVVEDVPPEEVEAEAQADAQARADADAATALPSPEASEAPAPPPAVEAEPIALERHQDTIDPKP
jgi:hypothetical protein